MNPKYKNKAQPQLNLIFVTLAKIIIAYSQSTNTIFRPNNQYHKNSRTGLLDIVLAQAQAQVQSLYGKLSEELKSSDKHKLHMS